MLDIINSVLDIVETVVKAIIKGVEDGAFGHLSSGSSHDQAAA